MLIGTGTHKKIGYATSIFLGLVSPIIIVSVTLTALLYTIVQHDKFSKWIKDYLSHLIATHKKNSMLTLFTKNIEKTVGKEYMLSYLKPLLIGGLVGSICAIIILLLVNFTYYHVVKDKTEKKSVKDNVKENVTKGHCASFVFFFSFIAASMAAASLIAVIFFIPKNVPSVLSKYIDKVASNSKGNGFIQVFKGIITESFKTQPQHDLIAQMRRDIIITTSVLVGIFGAIAILTLVVSLYGHMKNETINNKNVFTPPDNELPNSKVDSDTTASSTKKDVPTK